MADTKTKPDPKKTKGSQKESQVEGRTAEGTSFRDLIQAATGSEAPSAAEFESAMAARGYRAGDVRKLTRAFKKVNDSGKDYFLRDEGFDVFEGGTRQEGSGRAMGNKAGADLGDLIGLGSDVSLLAGALRNEKKTQEKAQAAQQQQATQIAPESRIDGSLPQSLSPETEFAVTMGDLLAATAAGSKESKEGKRGKGPNGEAGSNQAAKGKGTAGQKGGQNAGQGGEQPWKPGDTFQPDPSILDFELIPGGGQSEGQPSGQEAGQAGAKAGAAGIAGGVGEQTDTRTKGQRGRDLLTGVDPGNTPGFFDVDAQDFGLEAYGLGEFATEGSQGAMMALGGLGLFNKIKPLAKAANTPLALAGITGTAMKGIGDAINPNEEVNWGELGTDAANIAALWALGKVNTRNTPGASPGQLPGGSRLRKPTKFSMSGAGRQMQEAAGQFKAQIQGRAQNAQNAFSTNPFQKFNISSPGGAGRTAPEMVEMNFLNNIADDAARMTPPSGWQRSAMEIEQNFLNNLADDIARLPAKRRGGVLTKFRGY